MFKINRQTDYAVRVVLALAKRSAGTRLSSAEIQKEMLIPPALMARIVARFAHKGLVNTFPGRQGGLMRSHPISMTTLKDVVDAFEEPICCRLACKSRARMTAPFNPIAVSVQNGDVFKWQ